MSRRKKNNNNIIFDNVEILDAGAEGKAIARVDNKVIFIPYVIPGDIVDIKIIRRKKSFFEGKAINIHKYSDKRTQPVCEHFQICGGCKWQNMKYEHQLYYKQKQVVDNLQRIGKLNFPEILPIIPSENIFFYRNKLDFSFSNRKWLTNNDYDKELDFNSINMDGLGFHIPGLFDRIVDIKKCHLQKDPSNSIRLEAKKYALENNLSFYNVKKWQGFLRNLIIRTSDTEDLMVILIVNNYDKEKIENFLENLHIKFPEITSLMYAVNNKKNDVISDIEIKLYKGLPYIFETMPDYKNKDKILNFKIGPISFFQTNTAQAYKLYKIAADFAGLTGNEVIYDLYTGTGTIANFIANSSKKVVGIEYIESAIDDAKENSKINNIENTNFFAGDMKDILNDDFVKANSKPDVIITDPPRAGMHKNVINQILKFLPEKIVYISCNPATQARDISLMDEFYEIIKIQPVDMFPHTHHVENVILLTKKH